MKVEDVRRTSRLRLNPANAARKARATAPSARLLALLLAVLVAFSLSTFGAAHAHIGTVGEAYATGGHSEVTASAQHAHAVPCDDYHADQGGQDGCCMSSASCAVCVPVPSAEFAFGTMSELAISITLSASLPRDPPTLSRPPKLS